jgi:protein-tyrosine sulfotransferase
MRMMEDLCEAYLKRKRKNRRADSEGLAPVIDAVRPTDHILKFAGEIRGQDRPPAIFIHGMLQRSGTNFIGEILRLYDDINAYPNGIYELPFLQTTGELIAAQERFFGAYQRNRESIGENDLLALFGASLMAYLHGLTEPGQRLLMKVPDVQYLSYFFTMFPFENLLILIRDGRDLVNSTVKTWPNRDFSEICRLWDQTARLIMTFEKECRQFKRQFMVVRFEDAVENPERFARKVGDHFQLDENRFQSEKIKDLPVKGSSSLKKNGEMTWKPMAKPEGFNPVGRWRDWPDRDKEIFKKNCGQALMDLGYCTDLNW